MALQLRQCKEVNSSQLQDLKVRYTCSCLVGTTLCNICIQGELHSCKEENAQVRENLAKVSQAYKVHAYP